MRRLRAALALPVLVLAAAGPAHGAAPNSDTPAGAKPFSAVTVGNPPAPVTQESVLELAGATADAGVPRCLGASSFEHTSWAWVAPAAAPRVVRVSATPLSPTPTTTTSAPITTVTPDLALFVQPDGATPATAQVAEPQLCDGREVLGDPARTEANPEVVAVLPAGRPALVQTGWRAGEPQAQIVATLDARPVTEAAAAPAGDDPQGAPDAAAPGSTSVALGGATLAQGDPAQPACQARATVWRRLRVLAGRYTATADGAAGTLTAFGDPVTGDSAIACAEAGDGRGVGVDFRATGARTVWLRVGTDSSAASAATRLVVRRAKGTAAESRAASADALITCTARRVVLTDVRPVGRRRVRLAGIAGTGASGKRVVLRLVGRAKAVATVRVRKDGTFSRTITASAAGRRAAARYVASLGRSRGAAVALRPRFATPSLRRSGTKRAAFRARLTRPLAGRTVRLQTATCAGSKARWRTARTVKRRSSGLVSATVARPTDAPVVIVRAVGGVRRAGSSRTVTVRTAPQAVGF
jgi:hypothetical protein